MRTSRVGLAAVAMVVVTVAGACGTGHETVQSSGAALAGVVKAAATKSAAAPAMKGDMTARLDGDQILEIEFAGTSDGQISQGTSNIEGSPKIAYFGIGDAFYFAYPNLPPGKKWVELDAADLKSLGFDIDAARQQSATQAFTFLSGASSDTKLIGTETIDGRHTTHYLFHVNFRQLAEKQHALSPKIIDETTGLLGNAAPMNVWIGDDGRVARLQYSADLAKAPDPPAGMPRHGTLAYQFDLSDYGTPPTVTAPPPDSVMPFADYKALANPQAGSGTD